MNSPASPTTSWSPLRVATARCARSSRPWDTAADAHTTHPRWEGRHEDGWLLADLGDVIVHLLSMEDRARYDLEGLWQRAQEVVHIQ